LESTYRRHALTQPWQQRAPPPRVDELEAVVQQLVGLVEDVEEGQGGEAVEGGELGMLWALVVGVHM
jgi:hypothetical protein